MSAIKCRYRADGGAIESGMCTMSEASPLDLEIDVTAAPPPPLFMVRVRMP